MKGGALAIRNSGLWSLTESTGWVMASRTVKSHAVEVLPAVPCGTPWEMPCKRACCGSKLPRVVVAAELMVKNWASHSAGLNDVDIARVKGPVTVEAICT